MPLCRHNRMSHIFWNFRLIQLSLYIIFRLVVFTNAGIPIIFIKWYMMCPINIPGLEYVWTKISQYVQSIEWLHFSAFGPILAMRLLSFTTYFFTIISYRLSTSTTATSSSSQCTLWWNQIYFVVWHRILVILSQSSTMLLSKRNCSVTCVCYIKKLPRIIGKFIFIPSSSNSISKFQFQIYEYFR